MLTIDRVKLVNDHRFSLLTPGSVSTMASRQDNGFTATMQQQQVNGANLADSTDWSLAIREPSDLDSGE